MKDTRKMQQKIRIGLFDSGTGGLPVLYRLEQLLKEKGKSSQYLVTYVGDTKNFPYGTKTIQELKIVVKENLQNLFKEGCSVIGIACNTASIVYNSSPELQIHPYVIPIINLSSEVAAKHAMRHVHVIGSTFAVSSHSYKKLINNIVPITVSESGEQKLINAIETNKQDIIKKEVLRIIQTLPENTDVFVLGCTHFSLIRKYLQKYLGNNIFIVDPTDVLAEKLLRNAEIISEIIGNYQKTQKITFSGEIPSFLPAIGEDAILPSNGLITAM